MQLLTLQSELRQKTYDLINYLNSTKSNEEKKSKRHTFYINKRRHNKRVLSQTFAVLSFEFSNARAIVAI